MVHGNGQCQSLKVERLLTLLYQHYIDAVHQGSTTFLRVHSCKRVHAPVRPKIDEHDIQDICIGCSRAEEPALTKHEISFFADMCFSSFSHNHESGSTLRQEQRDQQGSKCRHEPTVIPMSSTWRTADVIRRNSTSVHQASPKSHARKTYIDMALSPHRLWILQSSSGLQKENEQTTRKGNMCEIRPHEKARFRQITQRARQDEKKRRDGTRTTLRKRIQLNRRQKERTSATSQEKR